MFLCRLQWFHIVPSLAQFVDGSDQINIFVISKFQANIALLLG